jgi:hypothetical protein
MSEGNFNDWYSEQFKDGDSSEVSARPPRSQIAHCQLEIEEELRVQAVSAAALMMNAEVEAATSELTQQVETEKKLAADAVEAERSKHALERKVVEDKVDEMTRERDKVKQDAIKAAADVLRSELAVHLTALEEEQKASSQLKQSIEALEKRERFLEEQAQQALVALKAAQDEAAAAKAASHGWWMALQANMRVGQAGPEGAVASQTRIRVGIEQQVDTDGGGAEEAEREGGDAECEAKWTVCLAKTVVLTVNAGVHEELPIVVSAGRMIEWEFSVRADNGGSYGAQLAGLMSVPWQAREGTHAGVGFQVFKLVVGADNEEDLRVELPWQGMRGDCVFGETSDESSVGEHAKIEAAAASEFDSLASNGHGNPYAMVRRQTAPPRMKLWSACLDSTNASVSTGVGIEGADGVVQSSLSAAVEYWASSFRGGNSNENNQDDPRGEGDRSTNSGSKERTAVDSKVSGSADIGDGAKERPGLAVVDKSSSNEVEEQDEGQETEVEQDAQAVQQEQRQTMMKQEHGAGARGIQQQGQLGKHRGRWGPTLSTSTIVFVWQGGCTGTAVEFNLRLLGACTALDESEQDQEDEACASVPIRRPSYEPLSGSC